jgi:prepilin-type processing-associated H-X9-DG protein
MGLSGAPLSPVRKLSKILRHSQVPTLAEAQDRAVYGGSTAQHWMDFTPGERLNGPHSGYIMNILFLDGHTGSYIFSSPIAYARLNAGDGNPDMDYVAILR